MILFKKVLKWTGIVILGSFILLVIIRAFHFYNLDKTNAEVAKIHATKLKFEDIMPNNLPPDPGAEADKTIAGIDANQNGIRDDVELAVFKEYPNSAKTRAVLLQYALALQMEMIQPIINTDTVTAVAEDEGSAYMCVGEITSRQDMKKFIAIGDQLHGFVENIQFNTETRKKAQQDFFNGHLGSYSNSNKTCDIDLTTLPN